MKMISEENAKFAAWYFTELHGESAPVSEQDLEDLYQLPAYPFEEPGQVRGSADGE